MLASQEESFKLINALEHRVRSHDIEIDTFHVEVQQYASKMQ